MCSYCGCESIECIGRFMGEHVELVNLTGTLRRACAAKDGEAVAAAVREVATLLQSHTHAEEVGLFAVLREEEEFEATIVGLCGEHATIEHLLESVRQGDFSRVTAFEAALRAHIDHEDNGLFPAAAIALAGGEWERVHELTPER